MKGWRTLAFNAATVVGLVAASVLHSVDQLGLTDEQAVTYSGVALVATALANAILRLVTTTPVGTK
jgi:hypothetical protein|tara:strand:+ start:145 stop:342 length:198 start_codon:yes stop_codon:yes gene_type:complete